MRLIDRILLFDPSGGYYRRGLIRAEADVHPDAWYLTCHFVDDMVMPGTLMYECCAHTLRVFMQRLGWITDEEDACYEPLIDHPSVLKCRGPVTPLTQKVVYEIEIKERGFGPEPYAIADANMYADGHHIVRFNEMTMRVSGLTKNKLSRYWEKHKALAQSGSEALPDLKPVSTAPLFNKDHFIEFALGSPAKAFGQRYRPFDNNRFIARLPNPPFLFIHRVMHADHQPWQLQPSGWINAEYDVSPDDWYFGADRSGSLPYSILLEIALQPCGWLAAYSGSALHSEHDLHFRNLGGEASLSSRLLPGNYTLETRCRLIRVSEAADMIIEFFEFQMRLDGRVVFEGQTNFGFFTPQALAQQTGIRDTDSAGMGWQPPEGQAFSSVVLEPSQPAAPEKATVGNPEPIPTGLQMPSSALQMVDTIEYFPGAGPDGHDYLKGDYSVNPEAWFFKAHFLQDPVCPGSLGIEAFIQLLKHACMQRWPDAIAGHRFALSCQQKHQWTYRGQILPSNRHVTIEAIITSVSEKPMRKLTANGSLTVDGCKIYQLENFGISLHPVGRIGL